MFHRTPAARTGREFLLDWLVCFVRCAALAIVLAYPALHAATPWGLDEGVLLKVRITPTSPVG